MYNNLGVAQATDTGLRLPSAVSAGNLIPRGGGGTDGRKGGTGVSRFTRGIALRRVVEVAASGGGQKRAGRKGG